MTEVLTVLSISLILIGLCYMGFIVIGGFRGIRTARRDAHRPDDRAGSSPPAALRVVALVPCLNEELVIGPTVSAASAAGIDAVVVVDDGSDDHTSSRAREAGGDGVTVVRRDPPTARQGKGAALNDGLRTVVRLVADKGWDASQVLVCVMDADGRLSDGALDHVRRLFEDRRVGGVQLPVRIRNRTSWLTRLQDYEFWGLAAMSQFSRISLGTVSLGGNGQFTRLSALLGLGRDPWSNSLTEDLDLALTLSAAGWRLSTSPDAYVDQQGVESIRTLIRQRSRWFQGHLLCSRRLREVALSPSITPFAYQETAMYLLFPILVMLPWSIVWTASIPSTIELLSTPRPAIVAGSAAATRATIIGAWYLFSFFPTIVAGWVYHRRDRTYGRLRAVAMAHTCFVLQPVYWFCCWRAVARIALGRHGWAKTARVVELDPVPTTGGT